MPVWSEPKLKMLRVLTVRPPGTTMHPRYKRL